VGRDPGKPYLKGIPLGPLSLVKFFSENFFGKSAELLGVGEIGAVVPSSRVQVAGSTNFFS
jgi:hypothetical protein